MARIVDESQFLPYGRQELDEEDIQSVVDVLRGDFLTTGPAVRTFERSLSEQLGGPEVVVCSSGTAALHLAMAALDVARGDAVVVPAITFVATANAARYLGAKVLFADVSPDTGLMTVEALESVIEQYPGRVTAAVPVHLNGQPEDPVGMYHAAHRRGIHLVADCAHALGTRRGTADGWVGDGKYEDAATFSFHPVKTVTMGEGGAVSTRSTSVAARARSLCNHGIERNSEAFVSPEGALDEDGNPLPWYYEMQSLGFNYRASDIACALGTSQLRKLPQFANRRRALVARYDQHLEALNIPVRPIGRTPGISPAWHLYAALFDFASLGITRARLMNELRQRGIGSQVHYIPVYRQPYYAGTVGPDGLPGAEAYYEKVLSLPLFPAMTEASVDRVVHELKAILC